MHNKYSAAAAERQRLNLDTTRRGIEAATYVRDALHGRKMPPPTSREVDVISRACDRSRPVRRREAANFAATLLTTLAVLTPDDMLMRAGIWPTLQREWAGGLFAAQPEMDSGDVDSLARGITLALAGAAAGPNPRLNIPSVLQAIEIARVLDPQDPITAFQRNCETACLVVEKLVRETRAISDLINGTGDFRVAEARTIGILASIRGIGAPGGPLSQRGKAWTRAKTAFAKELLG